MKGTSSRVAIDTAIDDKARESLLRARRHSVVAATDLAVVVEVDAVDFVATDIPEEEAKRDLVAIAIAVEVVAVVAVAVDIPVVVVVVVEK